MTRPRRTLPLPTPDRNFLSVLEAAALIGIGETTIRDLVRQNKIPHVRIGRRILFRREDLDRMMTPTAGQPSRADPDAMSGAVVVTPTAPQPVAPPVAPPDPAPPPPADRQLLTIKGAAAVAGKGYATVRYWITSGKLPYTMTGHKQVRIKRADLDTYLRGGRPSVSVPGDLDWSEFWLPPDDD